jgi:hypothetical protein
MSKARSAQLIGAWVCRRSTATFVSQHEDLGSGGARSATVCPHITRISSGPSPGTVAQQPAG